MEPNIFDIIIAYIKKFAGFVGDPRTLVAAISIGSTLRVLGIIGDGVLTEDQITLLLSTSVGVATALGALVAALAAIAVPVFMVIKGWTTRPSRGIGPWISK